MPLIHRTTRY